VQRDADGCRRRRRQPPEHFDERLEPTGGTSEHEQIADDLLLVQSAAAQGVSDAESTAPSSRSGRSELMSERTAAAWSCATALRWR